MIIKKLTHDIKSPKLHTIYLLENTPYCIKVDFRNGEAPLDFNADNFDIIPLKGDLYRPIVDDEGIWTNYPTDTDIDNTIFASGDIKFDTDNVATIVCQPNYGKHRVLLYFCEDTEDGNDPTKYNTILIDFVFKGCFELAEDYEAGEGIEIEDGKISVNDEIARKVDIPAYNYRAGDGISIEDWEISVNDEVAKKDDIPTYSAGDGIDIEDGEISVTDEIAKNADIPTVISELTNDVGYITEGELPTINMEVELEDGSTVTYVIYGQEQQ